MQHELPAWLMSPAVLLCGPPAAASITVLVEMDGVRDEASRNHTGDHLHIACRVAALCIAFSREHVGNQVRDGRIELLGLVCSSPALPELAEMPVASTVFTTRLSRLTPRPCMSGCPRRISKKR